MLASLTPIPVLADMFSYTGSVQHFTATTAGEYDIVAYGASGGGGFGGSSGGLGAEMGGDFNLTAGEMLDIYVGGTGKNGSSGAGGGGGDTFVVVDMSGSPLVIAGGGGGGGGGGGYGGGSGAFLEPVQDDGGGGGGSVLDTSVMNALMMAGENSGNGMVTINQVVTAPVPEPTSVFLLAGVIVWVVFDLKRRFRKKSATHASKVNSGMSA
jgi:hypothetical protein